MHAPDTAMARRIGIDLGGSKIDAIVMDSNDQIIFEKRVDTPKDYGDMVKAVASARARSRRRHGRHGRTGFR